VERKRRLRRVSPCPSLPATCRIPLRPRTWLSVVRGRSPLPPPATLVTQIRDGPSLPCPGRRAPRSVRRFERGHHQPAALALGLIAAVSFLLRCPLPQPLDPGQGTVLNVLSRRHLRPGVDLPAGHSPVFSTSPPPGPDRDDAHPHVLRGFGLSMDYEVFLIPDKAPRPGYDTRDAVATGLQQTGGSSLPRRCDERGPPGPGHQWISFMKLFGVD